MICPFLTSTDSMNAFQAKLREFTGATELPARTLEGIQVNLGLRCNLECRHCHLGASPRRTEQMSWEVMEQVLALADAACCRLVDLTGGAPEMHPRFREFVSALRHRGMTVQVRTNLAILSEPGMGWIAPFLRDMGVAITASLPCYQEQNVDGQRGTGVYEKSMTVLRTLNTLGYGHHPDLGLNLIYNPGGPFLPPAQSTLEGDYRRELNDRFGVVFNHLHTITNMPIGRFRADLRREGKEQGYLDLLREAFNPQTLAGLMCRSQVSVAWDGRMYDCDFNLALGLPIEQPNARFVGECDINALSRRPVVTGDHCFGCTAGCGSSCKGALAA